jgi:hypothetical protein
MSIAIHERIEHTLAIETLKAALKEANQRASRWESWALRLEVQMMREGWTLEDFEQMSSSGAPRPKLE